MSDWERSSYRSLSPRFGVVEVADGNVLHAHQALAHGVEIGVHEVLQDGLAAISKNNIVGECVFDGIQKTMRYHFP